MIPTRTFAPRRISTAIACLLAGVLQSGCDLAALRPGPAVTTPATEGTDLAADLAKKDPNIATEETDPTLQLKKLPDLYGTTMEGPKLALSFLDGKRLIVAFFQPGDPLAVPLVRAVARLEKLRNQHNFEIVGVASGTPAAETQRFAEAEGLGFPIMLDQNSRMSRFMRLKKGVAAVVVTNTDRRVIWTGANTSGDENSPPEPIEGQLRETLRLPARALPAEADLLNRPLAPDFTSPLLDGDEFSLASTRGHPLLLVFFLHNCPYCQAALETLQAELPKLPEGTRPKLVGVEISGQSSQIQASLEERGIDAFPIVVDSKWVLRNSYGVFGEVPVIFMIDASGRILYRTKAGWDPARDPAIVRTWLARLADAPVPMLLPAHGYAGNDMCGACHEQEYATWQFTKHSDAFNTLVKRGEDRNTECVGCHVVGWEQPGGYSMATQHRFRPTDLEDVGCESCHGRGGPHLSPDFVSETNYEPACLQCHDQKHSLGFSYETFLPNISHAAIAGLSADEREQILASRGTPREVLPTGAAFVGSNACKSCHDAEYETWAAGPHAHTIDSLAASNEAENADCQRCHTTGFGRDGGFPTGAKPQAHPDTARVGCESCHGPGADHVGKKAQRIGTIVSLTDKCDSCAILKVCGACHDEANDPSFGFEVDAHIERQRHGTITPFADRNAAEKSPAAAPR